MKDEAEIASRVLELAIEIQQIPAPTFDEAQRAEFVRGLFAAEGLSDVSMDEVGNVYARLRGRDETRPPLVVSAHLDTVFPADTDLRIKRDLERVYGPGLGDNSVGVAALLGLAWSLRMSGAEVAGDVWLVANVGEEGLGDLRGMKAVVDRFGASPRAYLILEGMAFGNIYHRAVDVHRYRITVKTAGGHAWSNYGEPSAIHELTMLAARIASLKLPASPRTTLNVGRIAGGTGVNVLAAHASLELDMRSESQQSLIELVTAVDALIETATRPGVEVSAETIGQRAGGMIPAEHPLVQLAESCLREVGVEPKLIGGSTDANVPLSRSYPAIVLGITVGGAAHTLNEFIEVEHVGRGMKVVAMWVEKLFAQSSFER